MRKASLSRRGPLRPYPPEAVQLVPPTQHQARPVDPTKLESLARLLIDFVEQLKQPAQK
jgi:hypothetical protein